MASHVVIKGSVWLAMLLLNIGLEHGGLHGKEFTELT